MEDDSAKFGAMPKRFAFMTSQVRPLISYVEAMGEVTESIRLYASPTHFEICALLSDDRVFMTFRVEAANLEEYNFAGEPESMLCFDAEKMIKIMRYLSGQPGDVRAMWSLSKSDSNAVDMLQVEMVVEKLAGDRSVRKGEVIGKVPLHFAKKELYEARRPQTAFYLLPDTKKLGTIFQSILEFKDSIPSHLVEVSCDGRSLVLESYCPDEFGAASAAVLSRCRFELLADTVKAVDVTGAAGPPSAPEGGAALGKDGAHLGVTAPKNAVTQRYRVEDLKVISKFFGIDPNHDLQMFVCEDFPLVVVVHVGLLGIVHIAMTPMALSSEVAEEKAAMAGVE